MRTINDMRNSYRESTIALILIDIMISEESDTKKKAKIYEIRKEVCKLGKRIFDIETRNTDE